LQSERLKGTDGASDATVVGLGLFVEEGFLGDNVGVEVLEHGI
jgi:hypothetical protein